MPPPWQTSAQRHIALGQTAIASALVRTGAEDAAAAAAFWHEQAAAASPPAGWQPTPQTPSWAHFAWLASCEAAELAQQPRPAEPRPPHRVPLDLVLADPELGLAPDLAPDALPALVAACPAEFLLHVIPQLPAETSARAVAVLCEHIHAAPKTAVPAMLPLLARLLPPDAPALPAPVDALLAHLHTAHPALRDTVYLALLDAAATGHPRCLAAFEGLEEAAAAQSPETVLSPEFLSLLYHGHHLPPAKQRRTWQTLAAFLRRRNAHFLESALQAGLAAVERRDFVSVRAYMAAVPDLSPLIALLGWEVCGPGITDRRALLKAWDRPAPPAQRPAAAAATDDFAALLAQAGRELDFALQAAWTVAAEECPAGDVATQATLLLDHVEQKSLAYLFKRGVPSSRVLQWILDWPATTPTAAALKAADVSLGRAYHTISHFLRHLHANSPDLPTDVEATLKLIDDPTVLAITLELLFRLVFVPASTTCFVAALPLAASTLALVSTLVPRCLEGASGALLARASSLQARVEHVLWRMRLLDSMTSPDHPFDPMLYLVAPPLALFRLALATGSRDAADQIIAEFQDQLAAADEARSLRLVRALEQMRSLVEAANFSDALALVPADIYPVERFALLADLAATTGSAADMSDKLLAAYNASGCQDDPLVKRAFEVLQDPALAARQPGSRLSPLDPAYRPAWDRYLADVVPLDVATEQSQLHILRDMVADPANDQFALAKTKASSMGFDLCEVMALDLDLSDPHVIAYICETRPILGVVHALVTGKPSLLTQALDTVSRDSFPQAERSPALRQFVWLRAIHAALVASSTSNPDPSPSPPPLELLLPGNAEFRLVSCAPSETSPLFEYVVELDALPADLAAVTNESLESLQSSYERIVDQLVERGEYESLDAAVRLADVVQPRGCPDPLLRQLLGNGADIRWLFLRLGASLSEPRLADLDVDVCVEILRETQRRAAAEGEDKQAQAKADLERMELFRDVTRALEPAMSFPSWRHLAERCDQAPDNVVGRLVDRDQFPLAFRFSKTFPPSPRTLRFLQESFLVHLLETEVNKAKAYELLLALEPAEALAVCDAAMDRVVDIATKRLLVRFVLSEVCPHMTSEVYRRYHQLDVGITALSYLPAEVAQVLADVKDRPSLVFENLAMAAETTLLAQLLERLPELRDNNVLLFCGDKALELNTAPPASASGPASGFATTAKTAGSTGPPTPSEASAPTSPKGSMRPSAMADKRARNRNRTNELIIVEDYMDDGVPNPSSSITVMEIPARVHFDPVNSGDSSPRAPDDGLVSISSPRSPRSESATGATPSKDGPPAAAAPAAVDEDTLSTALSGRIRSLSSANVWVDRREPSGASSTADASSPPGPQSQPQSQSQSQSQPQSQQGGAVAPPAPPPSGAQHRPLVDGKNPQVDQLIRRRHKFAGSPSLDLAKAFFDLCSDPGEVARKCVDRYNKLAAALPKVPRSEAWHLLRLMEQLLYYAKVKFLTSGDSTTGGICDTLLSHIELFQSLAMAGASVSVTLPELLDKAKARQVRDQLIAQDQMRLAVEVCTKCNIEAESAWRAWGLAQLRMGLYEEARDKLRYCFLSSSEKSRTLDQIIGVLEGGPAALDLEQLGQVVGYLRKTEFSAEALQGFMGNIYGVHETVTESSSMSPARFAECVFYLRTYGTMPQLIRLCLRHGNLEEACRQALDADVSSSVFLETVLMHAIAHDQLAQLQQVIKAYQDAHQKMEGRIKAHLLEICKYLNHRRSYDVLYSFQVFMGDGVRAAMTCVKLFLDARDGDERRKHLEHAKHHLLEGREGADTTSVLGDSDMARLLASVNLQMEISEVFGGSDLAGANVFGPAKQKCELAEEALIRGHYDLAFRIGQEFRLPVTRINEAAAARVARSKNMGKVNDLLKNVKGTLSGPDYDQVVLGAIRVFSEELGDDKTAEKLVAKLDNDHSKVTGCLLCKKYKAAYLIAVRAANVSDVHTIMQAAANAPGARTVYDLCAKYLAQEAAPESSR